VSIVAAHELHKAYGNRVVLRAASLTIEPRERVGVVGKNGAGKSTLAKILAGIEHADSGTLSRRRGARIAYLEQVPNFDRALRVEEVVLQGLSAWTAAVERHAAASAALATSDGAAAESFLAEQAAAAEEVERLGGWEQQHRVRAVLGHLGIRRHDAMISELSGGEQRRVALARLLMSRPDLAILDEPTNHLDAETIEWLEQHLIDEFPGAVLLITHDRYLLDNVARRTVEVAAGEAYAYDGGYERYLEQKAERSAHAARTEQNRQNFLRRELEWLRRMPKARTTKQQARVDRAEQALSVRKPRDDKQLLIEVDVGRGGKTLLEVRELRLEIAGRTLVDGLNLFVRQGERIGIVGPNGAGKTTLLKALLGEHPPARGSIAVGKNTKLAYFDQLRSGLDPSKSVWANVAEDQSRIELMGELIEPRSYLERFGFDNQQQRQPVGSLSGGERARVGLARLLRQSTNLLVLDEPTNDLDVDTLSAIEGMLLDGGISALIVTHDRYFLDRVATAILAFEDPASVTLYPGNYSDFRRTRAELRDARRAREAEMAPAVTPPARTAPLKNASRKKLSQAEERELSSLPERVDSAEAVVAALSEKLASPATYANGDDIGALSRELETARAEAERLTLRWEELESKRSSA
jgi:ATP-binding cassette subfamily F protein uup